MRQVQARSHWADLLDMTLETEGDRPLFQQIYLKLRDAIMARRLSPGSRLPSTREMSKRLNVSRTSVLSAYEQLLAEGYVSGRKGSGTFVSEGVPPFVMPKGPARGGAAGGTRRQRLSDAGERYRRFAADAAAPSDAPFATGCCSVDSISVETWRRSARQASLPGPVALAYSDPAGEPALRRQVAEYLRAARAVQCEPEQVIILSGAQQAIDLSIRTLLDPGDAVWVEDPGYLATREALVAAGAAIVPVPVDRHGLDVQAGIAAAPAARAVYITPSHQYPTGSVMSMQRRLELLAWASETGAWVTEDDYDSEFRYVGRPLACLQGLDRAGCVIYVGSLSKVLFPGLRLGFAVLPRDLVDVFRGARFLTDRHPPSFQQAVVAAFMQEGFFASHIRRMRQHYRAARDVLVEAIGRHMGDLVEIEVPECGIQLVVYFRGPISDVAVAAAARRRGVTVRAVSPLYVGRPRRQGLVLGYSGFDAHRLRSGAAELAKAAHEVMRESGSAPSGPAAPMIEARPIVLRPSRPRFAAHPRMRREDVSGQPPRRGAR